MHEGIIEDNNFLYVSQESQIDPSATFCALVGLGDRYLTELVPSESVEAASAVTARKIDEVALFSHTPEHAVGLARYLGEAGWEKFNEAVDTVQTWPINGKYTVSYEFYNHPSFSFRIEAMRVLDGYSALHQSYISQVRDGRSRVSNTLNVWPIVHLSYKAPMKDIDFDEWLLQNHGYVMAQKCESGYGRFSYWTPKATEHNRNELIVGRSLYLKPRVNTRDLRLER